MCQAPQLHTSLKCPLNGPQNLFLSLPSGQLACPQWNVSGGGCVGGFGTFSVGCRSEVIFSNSPAHRKTYEYVNGIFG